MSEETLSDYLKPSAEDVSTASAGFSVFGGIGAYAASGRPESVAGVAVGSFGANYLKNRLYGEENRNEAVKSASNSWDHWKSKLDGSDQ